MKKKYLSIIFFSLLISCNEKQNEFLVLTMGFSENPDSPRIGIEIQSDKLFVCKEKKIR
jgi:hypothetical protein